MIKIAPSILAADPMNLEKDVRRVVAAGCDWIHVDVMDAHFVPNLAFAPATVSALRRISTVPLDVHLMMDHPEAYLEAFARAGADVLTVHAEVSDKPGQLLDKIHALHMKAGLALKPGTPAAAVLPYFDRADMILVMTVEPGFGGQQFNEDMLSKISAIRGAGYTGLIESDGGINEENLPRLTAVGLDVAVMGTAVFQAEDPAAMLSRIKQRERNSNA